MIKDFAFGSSLANPSNSSKTFWPSFTSVRRFRFACTLEKGAYLLVEGKLVKREYEREIQAGKSSVKFPALAVEITVSKIVKLAHPARAHDDGVETGEPVFSAEENESTPD
jgi:hypothetical protein